MAWLEKRGDLFRIKYRYGGRHFQHSLKTDNEKEATACLARLEENLRLLVRGKMESPAPGEDLSLYLLSDGKRAQKPVIDKAVTLGQVFDRYRALPEGIKEENTRYTEEIHMAHLERLMGAKTAFAAITCDKLQTYVDTRSGELYRGKPLSHTTVRKEIGTLASIWNKFALPQAIVSGPCPSRALLYRKRKEKPPFQTWEQIERQIKRGGLSAEEIAELWDSLFLTRPEIGQLLTFVNKHAAAGFLYPMFVFAGHTGARRSEMLRSQVDDFDFEAGLIRIREKKKDRTMETTFRHVPMSPTGRLYVMETKNKVPAVRVDYGTIAAVTFTPDGKNVFVATKESVRIQNSRFIGQPRFLEHPGVGLIVFSPDGTLVGTAGGDSTARIWETATGKAVALFKHSGSVGAIAFSPDGKTLLTSSDDNAVRLWDTSTGRLLGSPLYHESGLSWASFSPDGKRIITASRGKNLRLCFWQRTPDYPFTPALKKKRNFAIRSAAFSPDGKLLFTGGNEMTNQLWTVETGEPFGGSMAHRGHVLAAAFTPDGKKILMFGLGGSTSLWEVFGDTVVRDPIRYADTVTAVAMSRDGKKVVTASDKAALVWDLERGTAIGTPCMHGARVMAVAFSPDGTTLVTGSADRTARLWEVATGNSLGQPLVHPDSVMAVAFSPDGKAILTGCLDQIARLWEIRSGKLLLPPLQHRSAVMALVFNEDGHTFATGSSDGNVHMWERSTGKLLGLPVEHGSIQTLMVGQEGAWVQVATGDGRSRRWPVPTSRDGDANSVLRWVHVLTGMELDEQGEVQLLPASAWQEKRLMATGGPAKGTP